VDRGKVEAAVAYGFRIIRWHFDPPASVPTMEEETQP
jgi:hypothetical protein